MTIQLQKYQIHLSEEVLRVFKQFQQKDTGAHEAGGILLAQIRGKEIFVIKATVPATEDRSSRYRFLRVAKPAQQIITESFAESSSRTIYIGEWHTHPELMPSPSGQDLKMIEQQLKRGVLNESFLLLIIVGLKGVYVAKYDGKLVAVQQAFDEAF